MILIIALALVVLFVSWRVAAARRKRLLSGTTAERPVFQVGALIRRMHARKVERL